MQNNDNDFNRRLERVLQARAEQQKVVAQSVESRGESGRMIAEWIRSIFLFIILPLFLFVVLPWYFLNHIQTWYFSRLRDLYEAVTPPEYLPQTKQDSVETDDRNFSIRFDRLGIAYGDGHMANADAKPVTLAQVASAGLATGPETPVSDIMLFNENPNCTLRRPAGAEKVVNVSIRETSGEAPVRVINDAHLQKFLQNQVSDALAGGTALNLDRIDRGMFGVVDLYVTDTSAPLYLVLQNLSGNTVWNLHAAPGVKIAHVAMVSGGSTGLAGDIGSASFEGIRAADFEDQPDGSALMGRNLDTDRADCMVWPYQQPNETWGAWQGSKDGQTMDGNLLFGQSNGYDIYANWYKNALGVTPADNAVIAATAPAALVGPVPAKPIVFTQPAAMQIRLMHHDRILTGTALDREAKFVSHYQEILAKAVGPHLPAFTRPEIDLVASVDQAAPADVDVKERKGRFLAEIIIDEFDKSFNDMVDMTKSNSERSVGFELALSLENMLAQGEAMPPEEQRLLYAMMRAPAAVQHHCRETLAVIAIRCRLLELRVEPNGQGAYRVKAEFGYVPNYAIGALERKSQLDFVSAVLTDPAYSSPLDTPEKRTAFLRRLARVCDQLRAEFGTCVISNADFYQKRAMTYSDETATWVAGWVSVYAPDNPFEQEKLQKQAKAIWERTR